MYFIQLFFLILNGIIITVRGKIFEIKCAYDTGTNDSHRTIDKEERYGKRTATDTNDDCCRLSGKARTGCPYRNSGKSSQCL